MNVCDNMEDVVPLEIIQNLVEVTPFLLGELSSPSCQLRFHATHALGAKSH